MAVNYTEGAGLRRWSLRRPRAGQLILALAALGASACRKPPPPEEEPVGVAQAPAPPPAAPRSWYEGSWSAELALEAAPPQQGAGLPKEWREDPGGALGVATLTVTLDANGMARGQLAGPLALQLRGQVDGRHLRATLDPVSGDAAPPEASFRGTLVAALPEDTEVSNGEPPPPLLGTLRLSSGDSLLVRHAVLSLKRAAEPSGSPPTPPPPNVASP